MTLFEYLAELVLAQLENREPQRLPENITIDELIKIAVRSHICTLLFGALIKLDSGEETKQQLKQAMLSRILTSYSQQNEFMMLIQEFEKKGIRSQPMKGIFMKQLYPKPELREMSDIDILIDEEQLAAAEKIISELGYSFHSKESHHDIYLKNKKIVLEVHWTMYDSHVDKTQHDYFHNFSKAVLLDDHNYTYTFSKEDFYIFMLSHMAKHFYQMGCGIRNLIDIYIYQQQYGAQLNKKYISQELKKCGIYEFACHMETLADIWLSKKECDEFYLHLFNYMLDCGIYGKDENGIWNRYAYAKSGDKSTSSFRLKLWYYFPPEYYMKDFYPWVEKKPFLLPVAWFIRFFGGIFKHKGTRKREFLKNVENENIIVMQNIYKKMGLKFQKER